MPATDRSVYPWQLGLASRRRKKDRDFQQFPELLKCCQYWPGAKVSNSAESTELKRRNEALIRKRPQTIRIQVINLLRTAPCTPATYLHTLLLPRGNMAADDGRPLSGVEAAGLAATLTEC